MRYRTGRSIGRYQASCSPTFCAAEAGAGTSSLERDLFRLLRQAFSRGEQPYRIWGRNADMGFHLESGLTIVIEYDGAYWHGGHEDRDRRKSEMIMAVGGHEVVRLREKPLNPLNSSDIVVPRRADSLLCASLAFPHLAHLFQGEFDRDMQRKLGFLTLAHRRQYEDFTCNDCRYYVKYHEERFF
jgi:hypothetical protein